MPQRQNKVCSPIEPPDQRLTWRVSLQGELLTVRQMWNWRRSRQTVKRGKCLPFSAASRLRLLKLLASVDWDRQGQALFITLTVPDDCLPMGSGKLTQLRSHMIRYMENYLSVKLPILWRVEYKPRKTGSFEGFIAPHLHLLVFTPRFIPWQMVRDWWKGLLGYDGPVATDVQRARGGKQAARYASKYAAKKDSLTSLDYAAYLTLPGRAWGITRSELWAWGKLKRVTLTRPEDIEFAQRMGAMARPNYVPGRDGSFTVMWRGARTLGKAIIKRALAK